MPKTVTMPKLSPTMKEGTITKWHFKEGDAVKANSVLIAVATDKAVVEYRALDDCYLRKILVAENEVAKLGDPIAITSETKDEPIDNYEVTKPEPEKKEEPKKQEAESQVQKVEESSTASLDIPHFTPEEPLHDYKFNKKNEAGILASPLAKKLAKDKGLDLTTVRGSGPGGRIMSRDLDLAGPDAIVSFGRTGTPSIPPGSYKEIELSPMRKAIAHRMQASKSFVPHFYINQSVNVDDLLRVKKDLKDCGIKITVNDFIIRAVALALRQHPKINSGFNSQNNKIIQFETIDIAVAVALKDGLITPIIRHADYKNLGELSLEMKMLKTKAIEGKLTESEYKGGSFTISNLGRSGVDSFIPVISPPQSSILAIASAKKIPIVKNDSIEIGSIMTITLSCDHRVVDGAIASVFIQTVKNLIEKPSLLMI